MNSYSISYCKAQDRLSNAEKKRIAHCKGLIIDDPLHLVRNSVYVMVMPGMKIQTIFF